MSFGVNKLVLFVSGIFVVVQIVSKLGGFDECDCDMVGKWEERKNVETDIGLLVERLGPVNIDYWGVGWVKSHPLQIDSHSYLLGMSWLKLSMAIGPIAIFTTTLSIVE